MRVMGIDLGVSGAIAVLTLEGALDSVHDMPVLRDGPKGRATVNPQLLAQLIAAAHVDKVFVEWVGPRPGEGAVGAFAFGRARGVVEGVCAALSIPVQFITAPKWKRLIGIPPGKDGAKDAARGEAVRRFPDKANLFARKKDDGRADALCCAIAGLMIDAQQGLRQ